MKIAVLGAGMVGSTIALDLSKKFSVTVIDRDPQSLKRLMELGVSDSIIFDLSNTQSYHQLLSPYQLVVCAVPGFMGFETLKAIILSKKDVVDISFFPENALELDALAKENSVTAIVDCGVAPGMSNLILGRYNEEMEIHDFECMVGGLPKIRILPFEYKAPFSPIDVIEEYSRDARYVENGKPVTKPALSDAELIHFEHAGTLESFNTDGLRSILFTMPHIPNMKEKTLRYPGHIQLIKALKMAGFFSEKKIKVQDGMNITPLEFTASLLFDQWKLQPGEEEFTIMKIILKGTKNQIPQTIEYFLYDEYDLPTQTSSMSRCTGYTCAAAVHLIAENLFTEKGIYPPELIGKSEQCFKYIMDYLAARNVIYKKTVS